MTREVTHFQQFEAALDTIQPNFPPGILQSDPKYSNLFFNMSQGEDATGPWNEGLSTRFSEEWQNIEDPKSCVKATNGLVDVKPKGTDRTEESVKKMDKELGRARSKEVKSATPEKDIQWSNYQI